MQNLEKITSRDNSRLVAARRVRDGKDRASIFIEGRRLVEEALRSDLDLEACFVIENFRSDGLVEMIAQRTRRIIELPGKIFHSIADTNSPQGVILISKRPFSSRELIEARATTALLPIVIFLKETNNPSNLGAILRTAEAAGIAGVIVSTNSADIFSTKALRASMGAAFRVPVWENAGFDEALTWAAANDFIATASGISLTIDYTEIDWMVPRLLIFGSEAHGLESAELKKIQEKIVIPMENDVESLNLAVSAGIILFEAKRQRLH